MRYVKEIQDKAVEAALSGVHLKNIQTSMGPNPAATLRYMHKRGIDYQKVLAELKVKGIIPKTLVQESKDKKVLNDLKKQVAPIVGTVRVGDRNVKLEM